LSQVGADVIGSNCGRGFDEMIEIIEEMRPLTTKPIIAQSNAGIPESVNGVSVYEETPEWIVPKAEKLLQLGVNILGGCCGTGPDHIRKMRSLVDKFN
jgi:methionine synthase I (cobalamin-dependent)